MYMFASFVQGWQFYLQNDATCPRDRSPEVLRWRGSGFAAGEPVRTVRGGGFGKFGTVQGGLRRASPHDHMAKK